MSNNYFKIQTATEKQWGLILAPISFYKDKYLIYYRKGYMANNIVAEGQAIFAKWSKNYNYVFFNEFKENELCDYVFLDMQLEIVYRIKWNKQEEEFWNKLNNGFDENAIFDRLFDKKIKPEKPYKDKINNSFFKKSNWARPS